MPSPHDPEVRATEQILDQQHLDTPIVIGEDGTIHAASSGAHGLSIHDAKGDYARARRG